MSKKVPSAPKTKSKSKKKSSYKVPVSRHESQVHQLSAERVLLQFLLHQGGEVKESRILSQFGWHRQQLIQVVNDYPHLFREELGSIRAAADVEICSDFGNDGTDDGNLGTSCIGFCGKLHICRKWLYDASPCMQQACPLRPHGHQLITNHNLSVLRSLSLDGISIPDLRLMKKYHDRGPLRICPFYNQEQGCKFGQKCNFLHVCRAYVEATCRLGQQCGLLHDLSLLTQDPLTAQILQIHKVRLYGDNHAMQEQLKQSLQASAQRTRLASAPEMSQSGGGGGVSADTQTEVCRYFLKGNCAFGSECKRSHDPCSKGLVARSLSTSGATSGQMASQHPQDNMCRHFLVGSCIFGDKCKKIHDQSQVGSGTVAGAVGGVVPPVCPHFLKGVCKFDDRCKNRHERPQVWGVSTAPGGPAPGASPEVCPYFLKGTCTFGDRCRKSHDSSQASQAAAGDTKKQDKTEICLHHLLGRCRFRAACSKEHSGRPYLWQYVKDGEWGVMTDQGQLELELAFCDPVCHDTHQVGAGVADFSSTAGQMELIVGVDRYPLRRLTTPSKADKNMAFATEWTWYYPDDTGQWFEFGTTRSGASDPTLLTSQDLEEELLSGQVTVHYDRGGFSYELHLKLMTQTNLQTHKARPVRRRPVLVTDKELVDLRTGKRRGHRGTGEQAGNRDVKFPKNWDHTAISADSLDFVKCPVTRKELDEITASIRKTIPDAGIQSAQRIQNPILWERYSRMKSYLERRDGGVVDSRRLFHGTKADTADKIAQKGFDMRLSGTRVGARFGSGTYLASRAVKAMSYYNGSMFLVRTLVGHYTAGSQGLRVPPDAPSGHAYDSCVDDVTSPDIFVIFDNHQTYPEYVVKLKSYNY